MNKFYRLISVALMPLLMPLFGVFFLFQLKEFSSFPPLFKWISMGGTVLFTTLFPLIPILFLKKEGKISDLFIPNREQRLIPYLFSFLSYILWTCLFWRILQMPAYVVAWAAGSTFSILILTCVNVKWKISAHMTGIGGFVGGVFGLCYRLAFNPLWFLALILFLSVLLGLARVETKAHTPTQALAGFIVGFLSVFLYCLFF